MSERRGKQAFFVLPLFSLSITHTQTHVHTHTHSHTYTQLSAHMSTPLPSLSLLTQHFFAQDAMHEMSPPCSSPFLSSSRVFCRMKRVCACVCTYVCMCVCVSASSEEMEEKEERGDKDKRGGGYSAFSFPSLLLSFSFSLFHTHTHTYIHTHIHTHARALLLVLVPCPSPPSHPIVSALLCSALSLCLFLTGSSAARTHSLTHAYLSSTHTHTQTHTHTHTHSVQPGHGQQRGLPMLRHGRPLRLSAALDGHLLSPGGDHRCATAHEDKEQILCVKKKEKKNSATLRQKQRTHTMSLWSTLRWTGRPPSFFLPPAPSLAPASPSRTRTLVTITVQGPKNYGPTAQPGLFLTPHAAALPAQSSRSTATSSRSWGRPTLSSARLCRTCSA